MRGLQAGYRLEERGTVHGRRIKADQDILGQGIGLDAAYAFNPAKLGFDPALFLSRPVRQVNPCPARDRVNQARFVNNRCTRQTPGFLP